MKNNKTSKFVNELFLYGILVPALSLGLPIYFRQQAEIIGLNSENIENACNLLGIVTGFIFVFFSLITAGFIAAFFKRLAFKKCGNEKILCYYQPLVAIGILLHFLVGYCFGLSTLPLYIIPVLKNSGAHIFIFTLWGILALLSLNYLQYITIVLTDKRALFYAPFFGSDQIFLKDVKNCYRDKRSIVVVDKNGHRLGFYNRPKKKVDEFYQMLTQNLKGIINNE